MSSEVNFMLKIFNFKKLRVYQVRGLAIMAFGLLYISIALPASLLKVWARSQWPSVLGEITSSEITKTETEHAKNSTAYEEYYYNAHVQYKYTVDGILYESTNIWFESSPSNINLEPIKIIIDLYSLGEITVYYDPKSPDISTLDPTGGHNFREVYRGLIFIFIGIFVFFISWVGHGRRDPLAFPFREKS